MHIHARPKLIRLELLLLLAVRWTFRYYCRYHFRYHDRSGLGGFGGGSKALFDYSLEDQFLVVRVARAAGAAQVSGGKALGARSFRRLVSKWVRSWKSLRAKWVRKLESLKPWL